MSTEHDDTTASPASVLFTMTPAGRLALLTSTSCDDHGEHVARLVLDELSTFMVQRVLVRILTMVDYDHRAEIIDELVELHRDVMRDIGSL